MIEEYIAMVKAIVAYELQANPTMMNRKCILQYLNNNYSGLTWILESCYSCGHTYAFTIEVVGKYSFKFKLEEVEKRASNG